MLAGEGFEVELPRGWYRIEGPLGGAATAPSGGAEAPAPPTETVVITRDGVALESIRIGRRALGRELPHTRRKLGPRMPPVEAAEVLLDNARSDPAVQGFELLDSDPATVGGRPGFRLAYGWSSKDGLRRKRVVVGAIADGWLYTLLYDAAARHYFDRDLAAFEEVARRFRLLARAALARPPRP